MATTAVPASDDRGASKHGTLVARLGAVERKGGRTARGCIMTERFIMTI